MKKALVAVLFFISTFGNGIAGELIEATLLGHVSPSTLFRSGETRIALTDSFLLIGKYQGKSILDIQIGFDGNTVPKRGETQVADFISGVYLKWGAALMRYADFPDHWKFIRSLEIGSSVFYDWREEIWKGNILQVGLAFELKPK